MNKLRIQEAGSTNFHGTLINNGTVLNAGSGHICATQEEVHVLRVAHCRLVLDISNHGITFSRMSDATRILEAAQQGDPTAADQLLPLVYEELRRLAAHKMANEAAGQTLQPTALVHEAWLRLVGSQDQKWEGRSHFFAAAAEAMRRILIDHARRKRAARHGGGQQRVDIQEMDIASPGDDDQLLAINEALDKLAAQHKVEAELVKLRYFVGMTNDEAAEVLGISPRTAKYYWTHARAWLFREIGREDQTVR